MSAGIASICAVVFLIVVAEAHAQEGLATSSTISGHNTIQQAPSGGRVQRAPVGDPEDHTTQGRPTSQEWKTEQWNDALTSICKGC